MSERVTLTREAGHRSFRDGRIERSRSRSPRPADRERSERRVASGQGASLLALNCVELERELVNARLQYVGHWQAAGPEQRQHAPIACEDTGGETV
jgi:hypothetical protein